MRRIRLVLACLFFTSALLNAQVVYQTKTFDKKNRDVSLSVSYPEIQTTQSPPVKIQLTDIIMHWVLAPVDENTAPARTVEELYARLVAAQKAFAKESGRSIPWEYARKVQIVYESPRVVCLELHEDGFTGGAHPFGDTQYVNLRGDTGDRIKLSDLIRAGQEANLTRIAENKLRESYQIPTGKPLDEAGFFVERLQLTENFGITKSGITFFYNEDISPHVMGPVSIELPYKDIHDLLNPNLELPNAN